MMDICPKLIDKFITEHQLPSAYAAQIERWFAGLAAELVMHQKNARRPFLVGIHGAQGSGKTTLAACLSYLLSEAYQCQTICLSLDDFYLTKADRQQLAQTIHPLLATRGVPGTHDISLLRHTLQDLLAGHLPVAIPKFNKASDDRVAEPDWSMVSQQPKIIILEGWCLGALPQAEEALHSAVNSLEQNEDPGAVWRQYVNQQLADDYQDLFAMIDYWLMLQAPGFDCIYEWRRQQEQSLAASIGMSGDMSIMNDQDLARFIQFYQRLTEHCLQQLPTRMDTVLTLNTEQQITGLLRPNHPSVNQAPNLLIFTDLDGSLLDHHHYRHDEADATLADLASRDIPVIPVSSKTRSEIERFQQTLLNPHPFICENGALICIPAGYFAEQPAETIAIGDYWLKSFTAPRQHWLELINSLKSEFAGDFTGFADAGIDGIINLTGLDVHAAARAAHREYGEAIAWHGSPARQKLFISALQRAGASVLQGGRFMHVSGDCDKGRALQWLIEQYQYFYPDKLWQSLAIGDSDNDTAMLIQADMALLIPSPVHGLPALQPHPSLFIAPHPGPRGWAAGVQQILAHLPQSDTTSSQEHAHG